MGFSLPSCEGGGSTARAIVHPFSEAIIAEPFAERIIPASPSLGFLFYLYRTEEVPEGWPGRYLRNR